MSSGVKVQPHCLEVWEEVKIRHKHRYVVYCLTQDHTEIMVESCGDLGETYEQFKEKLLDAAEHKECRYGVYDLEYKLSDGSVRTKLLFFLWSPENAKVKQKMLYTSSKEYLKKGLHGIGKEIQATDESELDLDEIIDDIKKTERI